MINRGINNFIGNPFYIQGIIWSIVVLLYKLRWSYLYPELGLDTEIFFIVSIAFSFIIGYATQRKGYFSYVPFRHKIPMSKIKLCLICNYFLFIVELGVCGIPLLTYIAGGEGDYDEFGLPYVHVIIVNVFTCLVLYIFYMYLANPPKKIKRRLLIYLLACLVPFLLFFNRGGLITCLAGIGIMYLMSRQTIRKSLIYVSIVAIGVLWGFGYLGDMRTDTKKSQHLILDIGQASPEFRDSNIPKEFFWGYIYLSSPLSNFQFTIDTTSEPKIDSTNALKLGLFSMTPEILSKRISAIFDIEQEQSELIISGLNVSSYLVHGYKYLGWPGVIIMYLFTYYFVFLTLTIINKKSPFFVPTLVAIDLVIVLNVFSNMFTFMGIIPVPFIYMLAEIYRQIRKRLKLNSAKVAVAVVEE